MGKKHFYAVKVGRDGPAIYGTWAECEAKVKGFSKPIFKGFETRAEAEAYIGGMPHAAPAAVPHAAPGAVPRTFPADPLFSSALSAASADYAVEAHEIALFTDGACAGNQNVATAQCPAGWGVVVVEGSLGNPPLGGEAAAELYGPVELNALSPAYLGAEVCSNNTGELSAVCEALRWLIEDEHSTRRAVIWYDSKYAPRPALPPHIPPPAPIAAPTATSSAAPRLRASVLIPACRLCTAMPPTRPRAFIRRTKTSRCRRARALCSLRRDGLGKFASCMSKATAITCGMIARTASPTAARPANGRHRHRM